MTQPNLLNLAQQGHPKTIAMLLSRQLQNTEITVEVTLKNRYLHLFIQSYF